MTREELIDENQHLFWYLDKSKLHQISDDVLVEFILNYGDMRALKQLVVILGIERLKNVYTNVQGRRRGNYFPDSLNYLKLLVEQNAH